MNIHDVENPSEKPKDMLMAIFARQRELMYKYHVIEVRSGLMQTEDCPVNLHDAKGQARLKDFAWRTIEEITEATEALQRHPNDLEHFYEELVDALHFFVEQQILAGINPEDYSGGCIVSADEDLLEYHFKQCKEIQEDDPQTINELCYQFIEYIGCAMNTLKNKPWKQSHMLTDIPMFLQWMYKAFRSYIVLMKYLGLSAEDVYNLYFRKAAVNSFRQNSAY